MILSESERTRITQLSRALDRAFITTELNAYNAIISELYRHENTLDEITYNLFQKYGVSIWRYQQWELERYCVNDELF